MTRLQLAKSLRRHMAHLISAGAIIMRDNDYVVHEEGALLDSLFPNQSSGEAFALPMSASEKQTLSAMCNFAITILNDQFSSVMGLDLDYQERLSAHIANLRALVERLK